MASPSKEENIIRLILENSPLREWHFEEVVREAKVTRLVANKWLRKCVSEGLLRHVKEKGRFPFFTAGKENPVYLSRKRLFALEQLHRSGLIPKLLTLDGTVILFGSMIKGDWYKDSDVDIFIFGNPSDFDKNIFEQRLKRTIEIHLFHDKEEIRGVRSGLIRNIINGYVIKGKVQDFSKVA